MRFATLDEWLRWQEQLHPATIELGLERVRTVLQRLGWVSPPCMVVTVGGTNGKGSSVAMLESILCAAGRHVGSYTSPHLLRYNERVRLRGSEVDDATLCAAFERVERARGEVPLTYFEFGTLAAIDIFARQGVEIALLEVGLGGRLDAVNVLDPDVALVTSIGIDHQEWLGSDRESIGREKAGIFRAGGPAVCGDPDPPRSLLEEAQRRGARLHRAGVDFGFTRRGEEWDWWGEEAAWRGLPLPGLPGSFQLQNAAAVLMVLNLLQPRLPVAEEALRRGMAGVTLAGRLQRIPGEVERLLDVAHNPHAAARLAASLAELPCRGRTLAVVGMLADKDHAGVFEPLLPLVDGWYLADLPVPRAARACQLAATLSRQRPEAAPCCFEFEEVTTAYQRALEEARPGDRVVVLGSFHTVAEILAGNP